MPSNSLPRRTAADCHASRSTRRSAATRRCSRAQDQVHVLKSRRRLEHLRALGHHVDEEQPPEAAMSR